MAIPQQPEMTAGGSTIQLCSDFQSWLLWAKEYHPTAPPEIRKEAERRAQLCESSLDDNTKTDKLEAKPMATKAKKKPAAPPPENKRTVYVHSTDGELTDKAISETYLKPQVTAALNIQAWSRDLSVHGLRKALVEQIDEVAKGNMERPEAMLLCQAHTLDFLFSELAQQAHNNQSYIATYEPIMRMALKVQNQCRMTLETLSNIKNPPVIFAKQANFSGGHQQINNGLPASHAGKNEKQPNELLLEDGNHASQTLDTRTTAQTSPINSELEAVENGRR